MGIVTTVRGGANYITENMDQWLSAPLALLFQLNNSHVQQVQELRSALEQEAALLAAGNCTEKDALDLRSILAQLESSEDEKARAGLDKKLTYEDWQDRRESYDLQCPGCGSAAD